jgi:hypothetical protein
MEQFILYLLAFALGFAVGYGVRVEVPNAPSSSLLTVRVGFRQFQLAVSDHPVQLAASGATAAAGSRPLKPKARRPTPGGQKLPLARLRLTPSKFACDFQKGWYDHRLPIR